MQVFVDHPVGAEPRRCTIAHGVPVKPHSCIDGRYCLGHVIDHQAGDSFVDDFGHRTASKGNDRRSARHGLHH